MASNGEESEFFYGIKNNASIVNASPTLIVSKNADGTYEHTLPGSIPLTSAQITTALGYAPIGANTSMTGLTEGAVITINTDTAKFDVSAGTGFIINGNLAVPTVTPVTITASTANVIPNLATQKITYVAVDNTGALYLTNAPLTATERRSYIRLGRIVHLNNSSINSINNQPTVNKEAGGQIQDILEALGFRSLSGNRVFPVSNNLKIKKELGRVFKSGSNFATLATQPHSFTLPAQDPITFRYRTQTGSEGSDITDITPAIYDLNGTITAVGSTATLATIQRIYIFQDGIIRIQPGQRVFTSLNGAVTALNSDVFVTDLDIENNALYLGAIVLTRNTVNLADIAQAIFVPSGETNVNGSAPALGYTAEDAANKQNSLAVDNTGEKYPTVDAVNAGLLTKQNSLTAGTNISIDITDPLNPVINASAGGGGGDMTTTTDQTVSGVKTFLNGKLGFRNVANTFTSFFSNAATSARTYTFQDKSYTVADNADLAGKMANPSGTVNFLSKFLTATTIGLSRIIDTGTFLGIGTVNAPTKDFTLGNQDNREIGIEESLNTNNGRNLDIVAGRTINFVANTGFLPLSQTSRFYSSFGIASNSDVYCVIPFDALYKQTLGVGNFNAVSSTGLSQDRRGIIVTTNNDLIVIIRNGDIFKQTGATGNFVGLGQTSRLWTGIALAPNGNIYACVQNGDIYKQTGGTGNFIALSQSNLNWSGVAVAPNGNVYATVVGGDIYKQTGGTGNFIALGQTARNYIAVATAPNGDVYVSENSGDIYKQTLGTGVFAAISAPAIAVGTALAVAPNGNVYSAKGSSLGDVYLQNNSGSGTANLDGGTLRSRAGTGKGTGKSRYEILTGQKTTSGTDMQIETLREYIDENGYHVYVSMPIYANNAAAITAGLPVGASYRTSTGELRITI